MSKSWQIYLEWHPYTWKYVFSFPGLTRPWNSHHICGPGNMGITVFHFPIHSRDAHWVPSQPHSKALKYMDPGISALPCLEEIAGRNLRAKIQGRSVGMPFPLGHLPAPFGKSDPAFEEEGPPSLLSGTEGFLCSKKIINESFPSFLKLPGHFLVYFSFPQRTLTGAYVGFPLCSLVCKTISVHSMLSWMFMP